MAMSMKPGIIIDIVGRSSKQGLAKCFATPCSLTGSVRASQQDSPWWCADDQIRYLLLRAEGLASQPANIPTAKIGRPIPPRRVVMPYSVQNPLI